LAWLLGEIPRRFARPQTVTHPSLKPWLHVQFIACNKLHM